MKQFITIYMIDNGYLALENANDGSVFRSVFLEQINMDQLLELQPNNDKILRAIIMSADNKINAIKAVRNYIRNNGNFRSDGLKDVKDYVELIRSDWTSQWGESSFRRDGI